MNYTFSRKLNYTAFMFGFVLTSLTSFNNLESDFANVLNENKNLSSNSITKDKNMWNIADLLPIKQNQSFSYSQNFFYEYCGFGEFFTSIKFLNPNKQKNPM